MTGAANVVAKRKYHNARVDFASASRSEGSSLGPFLGPTDTSSRKRKRSKKPNMNADPPKADEKGLRRAAAAGKNCQRRKKKQKKKESSKPEPPKRTVCVAEEDLIRCIDRKRSSGGNSASYDLVDVPKDKINDLPRTAYNTTKKPVVVITDAASSNEAVAAIRTELTLGLDGAKNDADDLSQYLGFDTETRPKFNKGGGNNRPALVQIATQTTAYLFRLEFQGRDENDSVMTDSLLDLLSDRNIVKVGVGIHEDVRELKSAHGAHCCGDGTSFLDLRPLVNRRWPKIQRTGLRNLTATALRLRLSKAQQMNNWEMKEMTPAMKAYAAADAFVALDLLAAIVR
jgi:RNA polymerase sigma factor for flagellar operon FliA